MNDWEYISELIAGSNPESLMINWAKLNNPTKIINNKWTEEEE